MRIFLRTVRIALIGGAFTGVEMAVAEPELGASAAESLRFLKLNIGLQVILVRDGRELHGSDEEADRGVEREEIEGLGTTRRGDGGVAGDGVEPRNLLLKASDHPVAAAGASGAIGGSERGKRRHRNFGS